MTRRRPAALVTVALLVAACSPSGSDDAGATLPATSDSAGTETGGTTPSTGDPTATDSAPTGSGTSDGEAPDGGTDGDPDGEDVAPAPPTVFVDLDVRPGVEQLTIVDAEPGTSIRVVEAEAESVEAVSGEGVSGEGVSGEGDGGTAGPEPVADMEIVAEGVVDRFGSFLARGLDAEVDHRVVTDDGITRPVDVLGRNEHPEPSFYAEQRLPAPGFGYVETRDGTLLSVNVVLPGPVEDGPYPTVVEYSGYAVSDPDAGGFGGVFPALGYAYVAVNMRGSGCSGGSFRFFEYTQSTDGYDVIEAVAAQPWARGNRAGMVGISYPGISQLFVAQTRPPSLSAITPLSVLDDSYHANLYPGGILNTGFAVEWTQDRVDDGRPAVDPDGTPTGEGQEWVGDRIAAGDETCAANQSLREQNPDLVAEIRDNPFYGTELGDEIAPRTFVDRIEVPTFLAGAWQDEQTGGRFPTMIEDFTGTDHLYVTLLNGLHTESISPAVLPRLVEFLDLYVAERTPSLDALRVVAPLLAGSIFGTTDVTLPDGRFDGMTHADALAVFEAEPPIRVLFEQGAAEGTPPLTPLARYEAAFDSWPVSGVEPTTFSLDADGSLSRTPATTDGEVRYLALPDGVPATFWDGDSSDLWRTDVTWNWVEPAPGTFADFRSGPLDETLVMIGSASADLWVNSNLGDTDLEVTLTELRPDGSEVMVQSGWLRASHRALNEAESTELRPVHDHLEADVADLPTPEDEQRYDLARVEILPFAHTFRAGSRIRMMVDAPGGNRAVWVFETISGGEEVAIAVGPAHPSALVLPVVPGVDAPAAFPDCASLKGQPCRQG